jgi:hypothetical protein
MESGCLFGCFQTDRIVHHPRRSEIVGQTADRKHQRVAGIGSRRRYFRAIFLHDRTDKDFTPGAIEPDHFADSVVEMMPVCLRQVIQFMMAEIHAAGSDLMQQRFP